MRRLLQLKLKIFSHWILNKYKPEIIGVTGSIGKTSAKDAIALVLSTKYSVRSSQKNYNNEIGVPLTIIGADSAGHSPLAWLKVFLKALKLVIFTDKNYPHFLVLELGVDRPGDMDYLVKIALPTVGVVTAVSYSHLEFFGSLAKIQEEKQKLIEHVSNKGLSVLNYDNEATRVMIESSRAKVLTYGFDPEADLIAQEIHGNNFKLNYQGSIVPVFMKTAIGRPAIYAILAGAAVGLHYEINLLEISEILSNYSSPKGRLNIIDGLNDSTIIDDTYNSSPESAIAAIDVLVEFQATKRYAVLGDMLELGTYSEEGHSQVGAKIAKSNIDYLLTVGPKSVDTARAALEAGMSVERVISFLNIDEVSGYLKTNIKSGDAVLVKGSQGARMERVVKNIMALGDQASSLLVRQGKEWKDK